MLNNIGLPGLLLIVVVVLVLFGRGKIAALMGEVGKGITAFKRGVRDTTEEVTDQRAAELRPAARDVTPAHRDATPESRNATPERRDTPDRS